VLAELRRARRRASGSNALSPEATRTLVLTAAFALVVLALLSLSHRPAGFAPGGPSVPVSSVTEPTTRAGAG
jgi:hypothetical protein